MSLLQKFRSAPPAEPYQQAAVPYTPITPIRAAYTRDPNAPDYRYQVNQKLIYERRLPGGSYITAHVQRLQSGYYDSPVIHEDLIDRVRFVAINFVFHPSSNAHRFKYATINIALHHDADGTFQNPLDNVTDLARQSIGRGSLSHQHDHGTQTAGEQSTVMVKSSDFIPRPLGKPTRPKFLRHAPHLLFGSISPETLTWNFNLAGSVGVSQGPASASLKPSGGYKGSYKIYEMMKIQGSMRTLRSWFGRQYDVEDGELVWTIEENSLQKSGLPREFTFVMLLTKGSGPVDTGLGDVILDIDIEPKVAGWAGTAASFPGFVTNGPSYRPIHRYPLNLDQDIGQRFEPEEPNRGFNFAKLVCNFDEFVYLPGTVTSTNDSPGAQDVSSPNQQQQGQQQVSQQIQGQQPQQRQLPPSSQQPQQTQQDQSRSLNGQTAQGQSSMPPFDNQQTLNLRVFLENSRLSPAPQNGSQLNLRIRPPSRRLSPSYADSTTPSKKSNRRSITINSAVPPTRFQSLRDPATGVMSDSSPKSRHVSGVSQSHSLRRSRDHENLSGDYHSSPTEQKRHSTHRDVTSSPLEEQDYTQLDTAVDEEYPDHMSTVSRDALLDRFSQTQPQPMGDPQYRRSNQYTQQHLSSKSYQQQQSQDQQPDAFAHLEAPIAAFGSRDKALDDAQPQQPTEYQEPGDLVQREIPIDANGYHEAPPYDNQQQVLQPTDIQQPFVSQTNHVQDDVPSVAREAVLDPSKRDYPAPMGDPQYQTQHPYAQQHLVSHAPKDESHSPVVSRVVSANPAGLDQPPLLGDPQYKTADQSTQQHLMSDSAQVQDQTIHRPVLAEPAEIGRALPMGEPQYKTDNIHTQQHLSAQSHEPQDTNHVIDNDESALSRDLTEQISRHAHPPLLGDPQYQSNNPYTQQLFSANPPPQPHQDDGDHYVTPPQHPSQTAEIEPDDSQITQTQRSTRPTTQQALDDQVRAHAEFMARELRPETPPRSVKRTSVHSTESSQNAQHMMTQTSPDEHHPSHEIARKPLSHLPGHQPPVSNEQHASHDIARKPFSHLPGHQPATPTEQHAAQDIARKPFSHLPGHDSSAHAQQQAAHEIARKPFSRLPGYGDTTTTPSSGQHTPKRQITITHPSNASHVTNFTTPQKQTTSTDQPDSDTAAQRNLANQWNDSPPDWLKLSPIKPIDGGGEGGSGTASPIPPHLSNTGSKSGSAAVSRSSSRSHRRNQSGRYEYPDAGVRYGDGSDTKGVERMERGEVLRYGDEGVGDQL